MFSSLFCVSRKFVSPSVALLTGCGLAALAQAQQQPPARPRAPQQQTAQAPGPAAAQPPQQQQPTQPREPFQLTPQQQQRVDELLVKWEKQSDKIKLFKCTFTRWDYDNTFGPKTNDFLMSERKGEIKFRAPDSGTFKEVSMKQYDAETTKYKDSTDALEHWVCDGKSIYQFKPREKVLEVTELPAEMRGKAITEGPLPFIFGAKAATLKARYWVRETTPKDQVGKQIWLEVWPRYAAQAADYQRIEVILIDGVMLPFAMQVYTPNGKDRTAYMFENPAVNDKISDIINLDFMAPHTPPFWKKVVNPANPPAAEAPPSNPIIQAKRPVAAPIRK